ncbi:MAG: flagellin [Phycisphaeraceae bacterium]
MSRINTNVSSLIAQNNLSRTNKSLATSLERLSTGLRINRGADDPAGLIVSERLRSEIRGIGQAIDNSERAANVISTAEASLQEVSTLLTEMKALIVQAANTGAFSKEEIQANQLQIDSAIESITRISNTTSFAGLKLLNGSLDYLTSGINPTQIQDAKIFGANFGTNSTIPVTVEVLNSAESASLFLSGNTTGSVGALVSSVTIEIQGTRGVQVFSFVSGTALSAVAFAVNQTSDATGVTASLVSAANASSGLTFNSSRFGSDSFVSVRKITGGTSFQTFTAQAGTATNRDLGEDVLALVNGNLALGNGTKVSLHAPTLNLELNLADAAAQQLSTYSFTITGGGANYQIGPSVNSSQQVGFGIQSIHAAHLGNETLGFLESVKSGGVNSLVASQQRSASEIVDQSIEQIAVMRGRLGAFQRNTLETTIRSSQISLENLTAAESRIRDTDFAAETSRLTRAQILVNAGTSQLAIANSTAQTVLSLLQ